MTCYNQQIWRGEEYKGRRGQRMSTGRETLSTQHSGLTSVNVSKAYLIVLSQGRMDGLIDCSRSLWDPVLYTVIN